MGNQAVAVYERQGAVEALRGADERVEWTLDQVIAVWLHDKLGRSGSERTAATYRAGLASYRQLLHRSGLDLDSGDTVTLATLAQGWAAIPRRDGRPISASAYNQRLAIVGSFYTFARKRRYLSVDNPAEMLDRRKVHAYARALPLASADVDAQLAAIDRTSLSGQRDYALLALALNTGRRLSEIAALRWRDVLVSGATVTVVFPHAKGGKVLRNVLARPVGAALLAWLRAFYGAALDSLPDDAPVWAALAKASRRGAGAYGAPLGIQSIADVCQKRLGTSKVHALRHTFAHESEALGAKVSDIQAALGHSSLATTGGYLASLNSGQNAVGEALAARFGITGTPVACPVVRAAQHSRWEGA